MVKEITIKILLRYLIFHTPKWFLKLTVSPIKWFQKYFNESSNVVINAALNLIKLNHGTIRTFKKLGISSNRSYYKKYLPEILISLYHNWMNGLNTGVSSKPVLGALSITEKCNLRCDGCFAEDILGHNSMSPNLLKDRIEEFISIGTRAIVIIGGEPFLYPNLINILANYKNAIFLVYTNATMINYNVRQQIKNTPNIITMLSLDGPVEITDARRGRGVFKKVLNVHNYFCEDKILHGLSFTVTKSNYDTITRSSFLKQFNENHLIIIQYIRYMMTGCNNSFELPLSKEEVNKHNVNINFLRINKSYVISNLPEDEMRLWGRCPGSGRGVLHIKPDGQVQSCIFSRANILDSTGLTIDQILHDDRMIYSRSQIQNKTCTCVSYSEKK